MGLVESAEAMDALSAAIKDVGIDDSVHDKLSHIGSGAPHKIASTGLGHITSNAAPQLAPVVSGRHNTITGITSGTKAERNNNPANITGMGGKLIYGAVAFATSNTGDAGDRKQLVFKTIKEGFKAMDDLYKKKYSDKPIAIDFKKHQTDMVSFASKLKDLRKHGIDVDKTKYSDLKPKDQLLFRKIFAKWEGYRGKTY